MAKKYVIEYKNSMYPYGYDFEMVGNSYPNGDFKTYDSLVVARKRGIALIRNGDAILSVVRGVGKEQLVYMTKDHRFVLEDRQKSRSYWYHLNKNGTLGAAISTAEIKRIGIIQSSFQRW